MLLTNFTYAFNSPPCVITQLTNNNYNDVSWVMNEQGDVAWGEFDGNDREVFMYDSKTKKIIQITDDHFDDELNFINETGDVAWAKSDGNDHEVVFYDRRTGETTQLTNNDYHDGNIYMHKNGDLVWLGYQASDPVCSSGSGSEAFLYLRKKDEIIQLTEDCYEDGLAHDKRERGCFLVETCQQR
jgi:hypothetical protein